MKNIKLWSEWDILKARYGSNNQYKKRTVSVYDWDDFEDYLHNMDYDIMTGYVQDVKFRFRCRKTGNIGIIYTKRSGNLLAHNVCAEYNRSRGNITGEVHFKDNYQNGLRFDGKKKEYWNE